MNQVALVCSLLLVAGAVEWVGTEILKRIINERRYYSPLVCGGVL